MDAYLSTFIQGYGDFVYVMLFLIIFVETGFVFIPFLPGDSLLFISGAFAATGILNPYILFLLLSLAAILGDTVNYWMGHYFGEKVFIKFIKREHLERTKSFFHDYGKKTIVLARFIPIVRTLAPFVAGVGKMNYPAFLTYNVVGGVAWVAIFVFSGFYFGAIPFVKDNLTVIILLIIAASLIPAILEFCRHGNRKKM
ncbi:MAG: VTT domain-containing protein [Patescibacteria group bacterium]